MKKIKFISTLIILISILGIQMANAAICYGAEPEYYVRTFIISAYYSPLPDQNHYYTGSYASEIRLNGRGTNGASGKEVYAGMVAAPKEYAFGTKMEIPGIGIVSVHDRGGAIKSADGKYRKHDRLDVWMGKGETGLKRALAWGKRTVDVKVYNNGNSLQENVNLNDLSLTNISKYKSTYGSRIFNDDVYYKSSGEDVKKLQENLAKMGYFNYPITGYYGDVTRDSVIKYQIEYGIIEDENDFGAGHFGVNSRYTLDKIIYSSYKPQKQIVYSSYPDLNENSKYFSRPLQIGAKGEDVKSLQVELANLGFLRIEPTGYFGEVTEHAVFKFQQKNGLVDDENSNAAGYVGPSTRQKLNEYIAQRVSVKAQIAQKRDVIIAARKEKSKLAMK